MTDLVERDTLKLEWRDGPPPKPWSDEWFIAETAYGDRVCLKALPEEWTYDFKTADDTYIKADRIKRWMQFPDSDYIAPNDPRIEQLKAEIARKDALIEKAVQAGLDAAAIRTTKAIFQFTTGGTEPIEPPLSASEIVKEMCGE